MIPGVLILMGILMLWISFTNRGASMWKAVTGGDFQPFG
jgi:hypothetical protein